MNIHRLERAIKEAYRFISAASKAVEEIKEYRKTEPERAHYEETPSPSRRASATRRASLDLSVALVELRQREYE